MPKIILSSFARDRHTPGSRFTHFTCSEEELLRRTHKDFPNAAPGYRDGVVLVPLSDVSEFFTSTVRLRPGDKLAGTYEARKEGEMPRRQIGVLGRAKTPASRVDIILYRADVLAENDEQTKVPCPGCPDTPGHDIYGGRCTWCGGAVNTPTDAEWEIISTNASLDPDRAEPMTPGTLMANHFHVAGSNDGGTSTGLSDSEFVARLRESQEYWRDKATAAPPQVDWKERCTLIIEVLRLEKKTLDAQREQFGHILGEEEIATFDAQAETINRALDHALRLYGC